MKLHSNLLTSPTLSLEDGGSSTWNFDNCVTPILSQARLHGSKPALRGPKSLLDGTYKELSYTDLVLNAKTLADGMASFLCNEKDGSLRGHAVAILLPRGIDYVGKLFSLQLHFLSAAFVPRCICRARRDRLWIASERRVGGSPIHINPCVRFVVL